MKSLYRHKKSGDLFAIETDEQGNILSTAGPLLCKDIDRTFQSWTLEYVTEVIKQNTEKKWIDNVIDRYLNFGKIEQ